MKASLWRWRFVPLALALTLAGVASVAYALGAASGAPDGAVAEQVATIPGHPGLGPGWTAGGALRGGPFGGGPLGGGAMGGVSGQMAVAITKIDGTKLSLQTSDGWTRTVDAAGAAITKAGKTVAVSELAVGDTITFREARQTDGTYKITAIQVVPTVTGTATAAVRGTVASKTATTIVITTPGKTVTVNVTATTQYVVRGVAAPTLTDVAAGAFVVASGTLNADGSLNATRVQAGFGGGPGFGGAGSGIPGGPGRGRWPSGGNGAATPGPSSGVTTPEPGSNT